MNTNTWLHVNFAGATPQLPCHFFVFWSIIKLNLSLSPMFFRIGSHRAKKEEPDQRACGFTLLQAFAKRLFSSRDVCLFSVWPAWLRKYDSEMTFCPIRNNAVRFELMAQIWQWNAVLNLSARVIFGEVGGEAWQRMPDITHVRQLFPLHFFPPFFFISFIFFFKFFNFPHNSRPKNIILSALEVRHADHACGMTHGQWKSTDPLQLPCLFSPSPQLSLTFHA